MDNDEVSADEAQIRDPDEILKVIDLIRRSTEFEYESSRLTALQRLAALEDLAMPVSLYNSILRYVADGTIRNRQQGRWANTTRESGSIAAGVSYTPMFYLSGADAFSAIAAVQASQTILQLFAPLGVNDSGSHRIEYVERGSVLAKFKRAITAFVSEPETQELADQVRQGLEAKTVDKDRALNTNELSQAIEHLSRAADGADFAGFDLGQVKFAKVTNPDGTVTMGAQATSSREMARATVAGQEQLVRDPVSFLRMIQEGSMPTDESPLDSGQTN